MVFRIKPKLLLYLPLFISWSLWVLVISKMSALLSRSIRDALESKTILGRLTLALS
jgi:hypothetical protein